MGSHPWTKVVVTTKDLHHTGGKDVLGNLHELQSRIWRVRAGKGEIREFRVGRSFTDDGLTMTTFPVSKAGTIFPKARQDDCH